MNLRLRLSFEWLIIGLIASLIVILANTWRGTEAFDNLLYDQLSSISRPAADPNILIVAIDEPSLQALGAWPWSRARHAELIARLQAAKPRSISLDILLSEPSDPQGDAALTKAMAGPSPVFIPLHFNAPGINGKAYDTILPIPQFASAVGGVGHVNVAFDKDGTVRRAALCFDPEENGTRWPHVMELAYRSGRDHKKSSPAYQRTYCGANLLIPYAKRGTFVQISYADLLAGQLPDALIKDRDIIIGATATGMRDNFPAPFADGGLLPGVEIMANMLSALNRDNFTLPAPGLVVTLLSLLPMWLLLVGFLRWRPRTALIMSIAIAALVLLSSASMLMTHIWFPPGAALIGLLLIYPLWGWRRLQAMSDFMAFELGALHQEGEASPLPIKPSRNTDLVGRQSEALADAIDQMRDLRRFVSDTLADLPDPMFVTDPNGKVTLANDLLGERLQHDIVGLALNEALDNIVTAESRPAVDRYLKGPVDQAGDRMNEFVRFTSPGGRTFAMRRAAVESDKNELRGYIYYLADITTLASAEVEREQVLQLLSHDMRAPQSAIIALLDGEINADARKRIERNARRTMQLAQDFVDVARMSEAEFDGEDILLADLIRDVADNFWPLAKERGITITVDDDSDAGFVSAEPDSLSRAFANLIDNAIKFSPDDGMIGVKVVRTDLSLVTTICDQGKGIDADILPRLFTRFATGGEQKGRAQGTGLGLTFVMAVVERHRGTITAANGIEQGACFTLSLPEAIEMEPVDP